MSNSDILLTQAIIRVLKTLTEADRYGLPPDVVVDLFPELPITKAIEELIDTGEIISDGVGIEQMLYMAEIVKNMPQYEGVSTAWVTSPTI